MSNLRQASNAPELRARVSTALVLAAAFSVLLLIAAYSCFGHWLLAIVVLLLCAFCCFEFAQVCSSDGAGNPAERGLKRVVYLLVTLLPPFVVFCSGLRVGICASPSAFSSGLALIALSVTFLSILLGTLLLTFLGRASLELAGSIGREIFVGIYHLGFGGMALVSLAMLDGAILPSLWLVLVVCLNDIAAYFVGSRVGGPRLAPALSPGKTISGSLAGFAAGAVMGTLLFGFMRVELNNFSAFLFSFLVVLAAQLGDLSKSYLKRLHSVKDSGSILPGHGGLLDRLDGILFAAPLVLIWLLLNAGSNL